MSYEGVERPENVRTGSNPEQVYRSSGGDHEYGGEAWRDRDSRRGHGSQHHDGGLAAQMGRTLRDNPVPAFLIGAGAAWLALSALSHTEHGSEAMRQGAERRRRLAERTSEWRHKAGGYAQHAREQAESLRHRADALRHRGEELTHRATDAFERQPLLIGALGMAVGAALGASMPSTRQEDELFGSYRDRLRDEAAEYGREQMDRMAETAEDAVARTGDEAGEAGKTDRNRPEASTPPMPASPGGTPTA